MLQFVFELGSRFKVRNVVLRNEHRFPFLDVPAGLGCPLLGRESTETADEH